MNRRQPLLVSAAVLAVFGCSLLAALAARAEEQKPKAIGMLLAVGDIAECLTKQEREDLAGTDLKKKQAARNKSGAATAELIRQQIAKEREKNSEIAVRVLALGDLAYDCGATSAFTCFHETWGQFEIEKILLPVPGNHEYEYKKGTAPHDVCVTVKAEKTKDRKHAKPYFTYFSNNEFAKTEQGFGVLRFPDKEKGPWVLVGLNPYSKTGLSAADLKARLNGAEKDMRCILAFSHPPLYSSGYHGHNDKKKKTTPLAASEKSMRAPFKALYEARASVLVAGHDHHYEQLGRAKHDGLNTDKGASAIDKDHGVRSFVVGTGGTNLYPFAYDNFWRFREGPNITGHGILKMMLYPDSYSWEFVPVGGTAPSNVTSDSCNRP